MIDALPSTEIQSIVNRVIDLVLDGCSLREAVKRVGISPKKFSHALQGDKAAALAYARALEIKADLLADDIIQIADTAEDAAKARNQIDSRKWIASKLYAQRYGERIDLNVTQTIDIGSTLAEARARLRPISDQSNIIDSQAIDITDAINSRSTDKQSVDNDLQPDIFS